MLDFSRPLGLMVKHRHSSLATRHFLTAMAEPLIQREHQMTLAVMVLVALAIGAVWWVVAGGPTARVIEIDRAEPLPYEFLVDVNQAGWPELAQLPEIGEILARRIVETRERRGGFSSPEDLLEVNGIGRVKLARITPHLLPLPDERAIVGK